MKPVRLWIGLVLLILGVLGLADAFDLFDAGNVLDHWWPVAVIGLGVTVMLVQRRVSAGPVVVAAFGCVLLANQLGWRESGVFWPTVFVVMGAAVLIGLRRHRVVDHSEFTAPVAVFGGTRTVDRSAHLTHADVSAIFGGATLDLREAHVEREATVDALALFGGVDVLVPRGWRVRITGMPVMGGCEDKTAGEQLPPEAPVLVVRATAVFGGIRVGNEPG
ncbi:LiaF-related protein [Actinokineospora auranticolor]|uniref:Cell wall-active antibiotic response 4TMS protein YvqF n=1 Tax=Actinokineospora auranticolor TaxID=155976 RepID=A0A2S6GIZ4_9PSEU|nr:LiaF domain-containing protein [Actinokineospora auranticolor]PPK65170.1 cell wall-active antibiotic response 4TMS protein YvqF [Actinokineospora auranticolor]